MFVYLLLLSFLVHSIMGNINLFISKAEMNRTLGLNAEMNYIENGVVNGYSSKFQYRVDSHVNHVTFTWNSIGKVLYSIRTESEDMSVLPVLRIPETGEVPHNLHEFSVEYRCAGHRSGQFVISIYFNFTTRSGQTVNLKLRQEKICASRDGRRGLTGSTNNEMDFSQQNSMESAEKTFYIIIGVAAAFLILIGLILISYFRKSKKESLQSGCQTPTCRMPSSFRSSFRTGRSGQSAQPFLTSTPIKEALTMSSGPSLLGTSSLPSTSASSTREPIIIKDKPNNIDVGKVLCGLYADREQFQMLPFIDLEGTFGEVRFAIWRQLDDANGDVDDDEDAACNDEAVMCKTLKKNASPAQLEKFLSEALVFHKVPPHSNLAQVVCAASFGRFDVPSTVLDIPLLCYRHQGFGNLKKFILNCRDGDKGSHTLRTHELSSLCVQLSRAMNHLHKFYVLHKDIATRNCIVAQSGSHLQVQLCDSAISKDLFPSEYHCLGDNDNRPVKWMSPEAIDGKYTSASDVWSFGVLCWELLSLGAMPYHDIDADDIFLHLKRGSRLRQPPNCPDQLYNIMYVCWKEEIKDRPSADQILAALQDFNVQLNQFI